MEFGFVFQQTHLVSSLTLLENVLVAGYVSKKDSTEKVREAPEGPIMTVKSFSNILMSTPSRTFVSVFPRSASREYIRQEMLHQMRKILKEKKLEYVQFYVNFVDMILPDKKTGKKPLIW